MLITRQGVHPGRGDEYVALGSDFDGWVGVGFDVAGWALPWNTDDVRELDDAMALVGHEDSYGEAQP